MAVTNTNANSTPGEVQKGEDVPSNLDAARPVIDRIKDIDVARDAGGTGPDTVIDNTPETAMQAENAEAAEKEATQPPAKEPAKARKETK